MTSSVNRQKQDKVGHINWTQRPRKPCSKKCTNLTKLNKLLKLCSLVMKLWQSLALSCDKVFTTIFMPFVCREYREWAVSNQMFGSALRVRTLMIVWLKNWSKHDLYSFCLCLQFCENLSTFGIYVWNATFGVDTFFTTLLFQWRPANINTTQSTVFCP